MKSGEINRLERTVGPSNMNQRNCVVNNERLGTHLPIVKGTINETITILSLLTMTANSVLHPYYMSGPRLTCILKATGEVSVIPTFQVRN